MEESVVILGIMSGTSLDGVDLALCKFSAKDEHYEILAAATIPYTEEWKRNLLSAERCNGHDLIALHRTYGKYLGTLSKEFLQGKPLPQYISSHGHTIFHEPSKGITFQLGCGAELAVAAGINCISDFRTTDVARKGQGAPLVPIGDKMLFSGYTFCLNLGGFINVSFEKENTRTAFDIAALNYVLNRIAARENLEYDNGGALAASGKYIAELGAKLDALSYYSTSPPKSLGREWVETNIFPMLTMEYNTADLLHTYCVHAARQVANSCSGTGKMLITGGGAYNTFFTEELRKVCEQEIIIPDDLTIQYKEALVFAYLGYLRLQGKTNSLSTVTGALADSLSGSIYLA